MEEEELINQHMALEEEEMESDPTLGPGGPSQNSTTCAGTFAATMQRLYCRRGATAQPGKASEKLLLSG